MGKHRDRLSIIAQILEASASGATKTSILRLTSLNFKYLQQYLQHVQRLGFIQAIGQKYSLTKQGHDFLDDYKHYHERCTNAEDLQGFLVKEHERLCKLCQIV